MSHKRKVYGDCPYCSEYHKLTRDHVIPECLYINGVPGNAPKIYACPKCNNVQKSRLDTYLRDFLILDIEGCEHLVSKQLFPTLAHSIGRHQSELARHARHAERMPRFTPSGLFAGFVYGTKIPNSLLFEGISMMTCGLHFYYTKRALSQDIEMRVRRQWDMQKFAPEIQILFQLGAVYKAAGDGDVFECIYIIPPEKPEASLWFLSFLRRVYFSVSINLQPSIARNAG